MDTFLSPLSYNSHQAFQSQVDAFGPHRPQVRNPGPSDVGDGPAKVVHHRFGQFDGYEGTQLVGHRSVVVSSSSILS